MALIPSSRVSKLYDSGGGGERTILYLIKNVDTADTIDLSADFTEITQAPTGMTAAGGVTGVVVGGTTVGAVSLTLATMADDNVYLLVKGAST